MTAEPIELTNIPPLYDRNGNVVRHYRKVILDGEAAKDNNGNPRSLTQDESADYNRFNDKETPSLPLWIVILNQLAKMKHPGLERLLQDLKETWLATSTRVDYATNTVTHEFGFNPYSFQITLPPDGWLRDSPEAAKALMGVKDIIPALAELEQAIGKPAYLWTPYADSRKQHSLRPSWITLFGENKFSADCCGYLLVATGRCRGARLELSGSRTTISF